MSKISRNQLQKPAALLSARKIPGTVVIFPAGSGAAARRR